MNTTGPDTTSWMPWLKLAEPKAARSDTLIVPDSPGPLRSQSPPGRN